MENVSIEVRNVKSGRCEGSQVVLSMEREEFYNFAYELLGSGLSVSLFCDGLLKISDKNRKLFKEIAKKHRVPVTCDDDIAEINADVNRRIFNGRAKA